MPDEKQIVVTDAPRTSDCPRCDAPASARTASNGFGGSFNEICGRCGHNFGEKQRHG